ncbi:larval cuticle protein 65Ag1-like [Sitodiplosis mosellana]|uniref:larval cuticle protein 65Ag1-like n=1 Tax=Sitodiplosis mosellana TaxID=263140 RepID=UPI002443E59C|nr:larval cuticle protein 65Ag1-like [Sitodiplosis mosellana]
MKFVAIAFFAVVAVAYAQHPDAQAETLRNEAVVNTDSFNYAYETSNGIAAKEQGQLKQIGSESGIAAQGDYSYTSPEGEKIQLSYIADENGFQPTGSHLPVAPAVPEAIARLVEYLASHPQTQH